MEKSELAIRREEMFDFSESNSVVKSVKREKNIFHLLDHKNNSFQIHAISGNKELKNILNFNYKSNPTIIDNDREELLGMLEKLINHIVEINEKQEEVPGFILLQSRTDFKQSDIDKRVDKLVNRQGFNKQKLGSNYIKKPFYDIRKFNQTELVLWTLQQNTIGNNATKPRYVKYKGFYIPELAMYNPNKKIIEVVDYKNVFDPRKYQHTNYCPVCTEPEGIDHSRCKKEAEYAKYVIKREEARYLKHIFINKQRKDKVIGSKSAELGIRFKSVELNPWFLAKYGSRKLKQDYYKIALIK